jgi:hypothetical protein
MCGRHSPNYLLERTLIAASGASRSPKSYGHFLVHEESLDMTTDKATNICEDRLLIQLMVKKDH